MTTPNVPLPVASRSGWIAPLLWSLAFFIAGIVACFVSENAREIIFSGIGYMWAFFTTPFILEASVFIIGLFTVLIINNLRLEREGEGWVTMEVKKDTSAANTGDESSDV